MKKTYLYYWYHHGAMTDIRREFIRKCIDSHDWQAFCMIREMYQSTWSIYQPDKEYPLCYFPNSICVFEGDEPVGCIDLTEETFNLIDGSDDEHG